MRPSGITVIIANLNGERYLEDCLASLSAQAFRDFDVVVVDNGSTDRSVEVITKEFPWVKLIPLGENIGFAGGNNIGIDASSSKYIATLNNDTIADRMWLVELYAAAEADDAIGMVASKILLGREGREIDSVGMLLYPDGMTRQRGRGETDNGQFDSGGEVLFPSACAALYRRRMLDDVGCFDPDFFSYCEDADLGLRGRLAGWKAVAAPKAVIRHLYSQTGGGYSSFKAYHVERNHLWVLLKGLPFSFVMAFPFYTLWRYVVQIYGLLSGKGSVARFAEGNKKRQMVHIVIKAYREGFGGLRGVLRKRKEIWKSRRLSLREYGALLKRHHITARELMLRD